MQPKHVNVNVYLVAKEIDSVISLIFNCISSFLLNLLFMQRISVLWFYAKAIAFFICMTSMFFINFMCALALALKWKKLMNI